MMEAVSRHRVAIAVVVAVLVGSLVGCGSTPAPVASCATTLQGSAVLEVDPDQAANAATIAAVGRRLGLADHAVTIALATAMQESKLRNLPSGDRDSIGLFQQRPSQGWGTAAQVATPSYAAAAFYRRLALVPGWQDLPVTVAAQAVQRSAYPEAYGTHEGAARLLASVTTGQVPAGLTCRHLMAQPGLRDADLRAAAATELGGDGLRPSGSGGLWTAASWLVAHAAAYGVTSIGADGRRWTLATGVWTTEPAAGLALSYS